MNYDVRPALAITLAIVLMCYTITKANAGDDVLYSKIQTIDPNEVNQQYCFTKIIIKQKGDTIVKEEILECADGRSRVDAPTYWQLFAEFYYADIYTPEYCRRYSRQGHAFKSPGKVCLTKNGEWEVK